VAEWLLRKADRIAPRIHGELLKLGIDIGQTTVAKYMARNRRPPSQGWKTFLRNHADGIELRDLIRQMSQENPLWGAIRRECLDHIMVFGERHLRQLLRTYADYYNRTRTHLSLNKDSPVSRAIEPFGGILPPPILGGLHHQYVRIYFPIGTRDRFDAPRSRSECRPDEYATQIEHETESGRPGKDH
jgi:hypothetical protein